MPELTQFIAKFAAPYFLVTGAGFLISTEFYARMVAGNAKSDPILLNLSGAAHFLLGVAVLVTHFHWSSIPEIAVSLLGIALVGKGGGLIIVPQLMLGSPKTGASVLRISGVGFLVIGVYFSYVGYFAT